MGAKVAAVVTRVTPVVEVPLMRTPRSAAPLMGTPNGQRQCKARAKSTGARCRQPAVTGFDVCVVHGAGSRKRVKDGRRADPREAGRREGVRNITSGLYVRRLRADDLHDLADDLAEQLAVLEREGANVDQEIALLRVCVGMVLEGGGLECQKGRDEILRQVKGIVKACLVKSKLDESLKVDFRGVVLPLLQEVGALVRECVERFVADEAAKAAFEIFIKAGFAQVVRRCYEAGLLMLDERY